MSLAALAAQLDTAQRTAAATPQLTAARPDLSLEDAYRVQALLVGARVARGERRIGVKMGFTSRAKMAQMGVSDLIWGQLTDRMLVADDGVLALDGFIHPRIEPEIAFRLNRALGADADLDAALTAVEAVAPAMEVIDSRYRDFRFSLADVIADNSSSAALVLGAWRLPDFDLSNLGMVMSFDGRPVQFGSTGAILGHPLRALCAAARLAAAAGEPLGADSIVLAGAATNAEALRPGVTVRLEAGRLGRVQLRVAA